MVELTPRSAVTEKVTPAIKPKDGRSVPVEDKATRPPPPLVPAGDKAAMPLPPPPGNFKDTSASPLPPPPGNFGDKAAPPPPPPSGNFGNIEAPPGNFDVGEQPPLPQGPAPRAHINHGVARFLISHDKEEEEEEEEEEGTQITRSAPGVNTWWIAEDIRKYLKNETPGAVVWKPWNAFIFDSITDFVSSLRAVACMPGAHFKWPEQRMTYEMVLAQAIHHLPPGCHMSIKNGNPCPKELLISTLDWHGKAAQYDHGTITHSLLRGIIRYGLKPTCGAGGETTARAWGQNTPMVYLSKLLDCACFYPSHDATHAMNPYKTFGRPWGGEIISTDGTPPIRVVLRCIPMNAKQLLHKHHKLNDQRGFMPKHVYISHIMIYMYALPPFMASAAHTHTTWQMFTSSGHVATADNLMSDESSSNTGMRNGKEQRLVSEVYGIGKVMLDWNITKKDMLSTRMNHRQTVTIKKCIHVKHDPESRNAFGPEDLSEKVRHLLDMNPEQDAVPVLEHTTYSFKNREKSRYHSDVNIMNILANHQLGNAAAEPPTQENQPEETKTDKSIESLVDNKLTESLASKSAD